MDNTVSNQNAVVNPEANSNTPSNTGHAIGNANASAGTPAGSTAGGVSGATQASRDASREEIANYVSVADEYQVDGPATNTANPAQPESPSARPATSPALDEASSQRAAESTRQIMSPKM